MPTIFYNKQKASRFKEWLLWLLYNNAGFKFQTKLAPSCCYCTSSAITCLSVECVVLILLCCKSWGGKPMHWALFGIPALLSSVWDILWSCCIGCISIEIWEVGAIQWTFWGGYLGYSPLHSAWPALTYNWVWDNCFYFLYTDLFTPSKPEGDVCNNGGSKQ